MNRLQLRNLVIALAVFSAVMAPLSLTRADQRKETVPNMAAFPDPNGVVRTFNTAGEIDLSGPFFQSLGTNGRSCGTCHTPSDAMSVSAAHIQDRFDASQGTDPIFRTVDGSNCDHDIDVSTLAGRRAAYSLLRSRGLIRIALAVPATRDYEIVNVSNPYGCSDTATLSVYRRPLPATNLRFLSAVMFDGRESAVQGATTPILFSNYPQSLLNDLQHQANDATLQHAQGAGLGLSAAQQQAIVDFEMGLFSAQAEDRGAGDLTAQTATGGPGALSQQPFYIGTNDPVGLDPNNPVPLQFNTKVFNLFDGWQNSHDPHRSSIARGQALFNTRTFTITNVGGLNGTTFSNGVTGLATIVSTCGICHDTPNVGDHSVGAPLNIGVADPPGGSNVLDTSYLPVITVCQRPSLSVCVQTTDPGRALITGNFADVAKFKGPVLRGLAARAPYFHNGSAQTLMDVVNFYNSRFQLGFTDQEKADLVAFLSSL
jgi:cytochrome c peroxidase